MSFFRFFVVSCTKNSRRETEKSLKPTTWIFQVCKICAFSPKKPTKKQKIYIYGRSKNVPSFLWEVLLREFEALEDHLNFETFPMLFARHLLPLAVHPKKTQQHFANDFTTKPNVWCFFLGRKTDSEKMVVYETPISVGSFSWS